MERNAYSSVVKNILLPSLTSYLQSPTSSFLPLALS